MEAAKMSTVPGSNIKLILHKNTFTSHLSSEIGNLSDFPNHNKHNTILKHWMISNKECVLNS